MNCGMDNRCGCQVGGAQAYPCKSKLDAIKKGICELEKCLKDIELVSPDSQMPGCGGCRRCCCCCCRCRCGNNAVSAGNQTTWGRCR
ncbi:MAG: hypothetical protein GX366_03885 [Epulopiscium sp.]|nr:hypothetical protein [Candidatus Epulonipiscium sp.]